MSDHDTYLTSEEDSGGGGSSKLPCLSLLQRSRTPTKTTATSDENRGTVSGRSDFLSQFVTVNPILRIFPPLSLSRSLSLRLSFVHCGVAIFCSAFFTPRTGGPTQFQATSLPYCGTITTLLLLFFQNWNATFVAVLLLSRFPPPLCSVGFLTKTSFASSLLLRFNCIFCQALFECMLLMSIWGCLASGTV